LIAFGTVESSLTIDIAESTCFTLLCVMKASSPIHSDVAFAAVETGCPFHAATRADAAELEKSIKDWAIISDIEFALLFRVAFHIIWRDFLKELNIFIGVKLGHLMFVGGLGSL
jgi:hypothetical protein